MLELTSPVAALQIFTQILGRLRVFQNLGREYLIRVQSSLLFPLCVCFIFEGMLIFGEHEHNSMPENTDAEILTDLMRRLLWILITCAVSTWLGFVSFRVHQLDYFVGEPSIAVFLFFSLGVS